MRENEVLGGPEYYMNSMTSRERTAKCGFRLWLDTVRGPVKIPSRAGPGRMLLMPALKL